MSFRERRKYRIDELPRDLHEALECLEKDEVIRGALGEHIYARFVDAKRGEWQDYFRQVESVGAGEVLGAILTGIRRGGSGANAERLNSETMPRPHPSTMLEEPTARHQ
jgi:hypothetical protein